MTKIITKIINLQRKMSEGIILAQLHELYFWKRSKLVLSPNFLKITHDKAKLNFIVNMILAL